MHEVRLGGEIYEPSKVVCVGKNFPDHIREMGTVEAPSEPVIFIKPNSAVVFSPSELFIPQSLGLLHHEVELCAIMGRPVRNVSVQEAQDAIAGWAVGLDLTLRELQARAKTAGEPWALSKGFDGAAVLGRFIETREVLDSRSVVLSLFVNGSVRQQGNTADMIFQPAKIISFVSGFMTLEKGDVIMCGTPSGVGPLNDGDKVAAEAEGLPRLEFTLKRKQGG